MSSIGILHIYYDDVNEAFARDVDRRKTFTRTDMYISTLRSFVEAMGGNLEIKAVFPDGDVRINQFEGLEKDTANVAK